ncbi:MAG: response regulator [Desulfobacterales bacterium]
MKQTEKVHILVVDDEEIIRRLIQRALQISGYLYSSASSGEEALKILENKKVDVVITDITMPGMTGIELVRMVRERYDSDVIIMTGYTADFAYEEAIEEGANDFIQKPINIKEFMIRLKRVLRERALLLEMDKSNIKLQDALDGLRKNLSGTIQVIVSTVEHRDPYTSGHQQRVADLARAIAREMRLSEDIIEGIHMAGLIHDLGKIAIPSEILSKPVRLTDLEFALIKTHPQVGYDILKDIKFPWPVAEITYQHHERIDGSGYPRGLKGENILHEARIMAVADVVEAMASHRPYRPALGINAALEEILKNKGKSYDLHVADACLEVFRKGEFKF